MDRPGHPADPRAVLTSFGVSEVDGHTFLIHRKNGVALHLNPSAALLFDDLSQSYDVLQSARNLSSRIGVSETVLIADILTLLDTLASGVEDPEISDDEDLTMPLAEFIPADTTVKEKRGWYRLANLTVLVRTSDQLVLDELNEFFQLGESLDAEAIEVELIEGRNGYCINLDGIPYCAFEDGTYVQRVLRSCLYQVLYQRNARSLLLHAGAVANKSGEAVLFIAPSGFGKTTLTVHLALSGLDYLGDDVQLLDLESGHIWPVATAAGLKEGAQAIFSERIPGLAELPVRDKSFRPARYLNLDVKRPARLYAVKAIVFPQFDAEAEPFIQPMDVESIFPAVYESGAYSALKTSESVTRLCIEFFIGRPCYWMTYATSDQAVELLTHQKVLEGSS